MRLTQFFPADRLPALKWIGTKPWIEIYTDPNGVENTSYSIKQDALRPTKDDHQRFTDVDFQFGNILVERIKSATMADCMFLHTFSKALSDGFKLFQPSFEQ